MATTIYKEKQRFHDWLTIGLLSLASVGLLYSAVSYFWLPEITLFYSLVCLVLAVGLGYVIWGLLNLRSKLTVTNKKIKFQLQGSFETSKKIAWEDVESCTVVQTPRLAKWNRPKVTLTDEEFYSLDGRNGLMITTKDGKQYFIGCQNVEDLQQALNSQDKIWEMVA